MHLESVVKDHLEARTKVTNSEPAEWSKELIEKTKKFKFLSKRQAIAAEIKSYSVTEAIAGNQPEETGLAEDVSAHRE